MRTFLRFCIRAELILLSLAIYWHHYIPRLVPYAKPSEPAFEVTETEPYYTHAFDVGIQSYRGNGHNFYIQNWQDADPWVESKVATAGQCEVTTPCSLKMVFKGNTIVSEP